jgi:hypothetical protein
LISDKVHKDLKEVISAIQPLKKLNFQISYPCQRAY